MKSLSSIVLAAIFTASALAAPLIINTPVSVESGEPTLLTWSGGEAPYHLTVHSGTNPAIVLEDLGVHEGTSFTWDTDLAAGTEVGFAVRDKEHDLAQSAPVVIQ